MATELDHRVARVDRLAGTRIGIGYQGVDGRGDMALGDLPLRLGEPGLCLLHHGALRSDLYSRPVGDSICASFALAASARATAEARSACCWSTV